MKAALLGGTNSGCGKTTLTLALLQYLRLQETEITSFKTGPDFLDPFWHQAVTGKPCYNLDPMMMDQAELARVLERERVEIGLIEGVMGLFDARDGIGEKGSGADLSKRLDVPVLLVVDAKGMSGSIAPLVKGFVDYGSQQNVRISGVIANKVGSENHAKLLQDYLQEEGLPPLVAWMDKHAPAIPERHLGLTMPEASLSEKTLPDWQPHLHVLAGFTDAFGELKTQLESESETKIKAADSKRLLEGKKIAIAKDEAFNFIYPANLDWLGSQGAEVCFFSIQKGEELPTGADALWLPGGYPELYAEELSTSKSWKGILAFIEAGGPTLAECGGMMALGENLTSHEGTSHPMAGLLPFASKMQDRLASLGYRETSSGVKGHEFHHSKRVMQKTANLPPAFEMEKGDEGMSYKKLQASYVHWYFASAPVTVAQWFGYLPK